MSLFDEFQWRGLVHSHTEELPKALASSSITGYIGFDPTAPSLHVGSLLPIMALARFQRFGHSPIGLLGGGTGLIGDPSGKTAERPLISKQQAEHNVSHIREQIGRFVDFDAMVHPAVLVNNADWLTTISLTDFLRDVGKYFTVNTMLAKESVRRRLELEDGLSFTEFSYMLLQAYDFLVLYDRHGCTLQMGGSDQWGNITAGIELIRRTRNVHAHGLVFPLISNASGTKFGKTEAGTVWLDANLTSPFHFYQFWLNTDDRDVIPYLKYFTWLTEPEVGELQRQHDVSPERREAQRRLAREVTLATHGEGALAKAERASAVLFGSEVEGLEPEEIRDIFSDTPSSEVERAQFANSGAPLVDLLVQCGLATSRGDARRTIESGGIYVNNRRVGTVQHSIRFAESIGGQYIVLRKGQRQYHLVRLV